MRLAEMLGIATLEKKKKIRAEFKKKGFGNARLIKSRDVHCVIAENGEAMVLAFRGSTTMKDWINTLKTAPLKELDTGLPGRVHRGFYRALASRCRTTERECEVDISLKNS